MKKNQTMKIYKTISTKSHMHVLSFPQNKLKKEENFSRLNLSKINQEWRSILRNIKVEQLRKEFHQIEIFFNASLEQKNRIINKLLKQLDIAEDMYLKSHQSNLEDLKMLSGGFPSKK